MQQQISVITLGVGDLQVSKAFYAGGFGWAPVFENDEIAFYQMNGLVLGTWLKPQLEADMQRAGSPGSGAVALAHNVGGVEEVRQLVERLVGAGGQLLRAPDAPPRAGCASARRFPRLCRRSRRTRLGDRLEPRLADRCARPCDVRRLSGS
jgi:catechol 2,3-dioxygenase-like lactoylglutathione lyase family enzyme